MKTLCKLSTPLRSLKFRHWTSNIVALMSVSLVSCGKSGENVETLLPSVEGLKSVRGNGVSVEVKPASGSIEGGERIALIGMNIGDTFAQASSGASQGLQIEIGGKACELARAETRDAISCVTPSAVEGAADVVLRSGSQVLMTLAKAFVFIPPLQVTAISPG